ncbi:UNKNOWN [Stylonychia lemnae]|uniref:Uncharacterized protein n=1 Tax=Stylonychia lemnae TaxID=5949 RepID=A0A077ZSY6_STYLE|nr:UNKNOWN [Stylonychia lemnae]|eukprot:CDW72997.1 UNKNOWN [Stylonychia lemnae]
MDKKKTKFHIKDFTTGQLLYEIPQDLLDISSGQNPSQVINRFDFLDEERFKIVSEEGIEKILHIDSGFKEIAFNYIPLFKDIMEIEYVSYSYYRSRSIYYWPIVNLLQYTYQKYKSLYNLEGKQTFEQMNPLMFTIDIDYTDRSIAPFTFAHWSLIEQIQQGKLKIEELQENVVREIMYIAHPQGKEIKFHMPFISNLDGESPIHLCIKKQAFKNIDIMLNCLSLYPIDHHSRTIKDLYPDFLELKLHNFLDYIDSRIQQTQQLEQINKGALKENYPEIIIQDLWFDEKAFKQQIFTTGAVESRIKCEILDMPGIYHMKDQDFNSKAVRKLIEFNYPLVKEYILKKLFLPFCLFHLCFVISMNFIFENRHLNGFSQVYYPLLILNAIFATYFLSNEMKQLYSSFSNMQ